MKLLVTGGAGFIGSCLVRKLIKETPHSVINIDKLTYAGHLGNLSSVSKNSRYLFERVDIQDSLALKNIFAKYKPDGVIHLAAESHVDRSIDGPADFINTNIIGTYQLLEAARVFWMNLMPTQKTHFRFLHVSTDEVYGSLGSRGYFSERSKVKPNSPYAASKAASDHLVSAWYHTYGLPTMITHCSNNYGPYQYPEKLIPLCIRRALDGKTIPVYGDGKNIRDWLYVSDHVDALLLVLKRGQVGESYTIGGQCEMENIAVVKMICQILDEICPREASYHTQIAFVKDRPGHDRRYAMDIAKIEKELSWKPKETFYSGLKKTTRWYLKNQSWSKAILKGKYKQERLGLKEMGL